MTELDKIESEIAATQEKLRQLEEKASELRRAKKQAALEEIWRKMAEVGLSAADLNPTSNIKTRRTRTFRKYYLLNGVKYTVKPGRLPAEIAAYKADGGNLNEIIFLDDDE